MRRNIQEWSTQNLWNTALNLSEKVCFNRTQLFKFFKVCIAWGYSRFLKEASNTKKDVY